MPPARPPTIPRPDHPPAAASTHNPNQHQSVVPDQPAGTARKSVMAKRPSKPEEPKPATPEMRVMPLVALRETVIFPEMIVPLQVGRDKSVAALNAATESGGPIALVTQRRAEQEDIGDPSELYGIGTMAKIAQVVQLQDGTVRAIVQGQRRIRVLGFTQTSPYLIAVASPS